MCGIFGLLSKTTLDPEHYQRLGLSNTDRGNLGFGTFVSSKNTAHVYRYPTAFDAAKLSLEGSNVALGHVRAPTGGQSDNLTEIHPFETRDLLLAHNGLLLNYRDFPQWRIDSEIDVDSQVIMGGIQCYLDQGANLHHAIRVTVEQLDGQQACWLWHKPTAALYLWRVMSPVYCTTGSDWFAFSSTRCELADQPLREGIIYRFDSDAFRLTEAETFSYYSPYQMSKIK